MTSKEMNKEMFFRTYAKELEAAVIDHGDEYRYGLEAVPAVVEKMRDAFENRTFNKDSRAIKSTCHLLGIKYTYKAIGEFIQGGSK
jgi:hypothetical protein